MTEQPQSAPMAARIGAMWERFQPRFLERVRVLEQAAVAILADELTPEQRRAAEREAHKLAGAAGTFGFHAATRHARVIETLLEGTAPLPQNAALSISESVLALRQQLEQARDAADVPRPDEAPPLLLLLGDSDLAERLEAEAAARGIRCLRFGDVEAALHEIRAQPAAIVMDTEAASPAGRLSALDSLAAAPHQPPIILITQDDHLAHRVAAVQRGVRAILTPPFSPAQVLDAVERSTTHRFSAGAKLLVVDDDPLVLHFLDRLLGARGMHVHGVSDAAMFWIELRRVLPDLAILDFDMPGLNGIDLCRALRSDPHWSPLPVLFLTGRTDPAGISAIFDAGADDYVPKPVIGPELVVRVENRLERARLHGTHGAGVTSLPDRRRTKDDLSRIVRLAERAGVSAAVARIDMDAMAHVNERLGNAAGDEALKRVARLLESHLTPGDVLGSWGGDEFAIALFDADSRRAVELLREVLAAVKREAIPVADGDLRISFTAGVASYPGDGADATALMAAADQALTRAKADGGARIAEHRDARPSGVSVDIAIVEDDTIIGELLLHALQVQGYSVRWLRDGDQALASLGGPEPSLRARVIVLDVDLPGVDGLGVLRELSAHDAIRSTRIIMLTVRSTEREILTALDLGAADHIAKPFSLPVLLQRIRGHMGRG